MVQREYAATATAPIFDRHILDEFCATVGPAAPALLRGIVQVYLSETPQTIALIRMALEAYNLERAAALLHRMKGSSLSIGAARMAYTCSTLEQSIADKNTLRSIFTLADEFTLVAAALDAYLAERVGPMYQVR
jgi:HPt (histidine-containing phosphotransfer) domain-containing protein